MLFFPKKIVLGFFVFSFFPLFTEDNLNIRISDLEKQMLEVSTETMGGTYGAKFASSYGNTEGFHMEIFGEALFWQAKVGGREYSYSSSNMKFPKPRIPFVGKIQEVNLDWDFGFRVGLGFLLSEENWNLNFVYTDFNTSNQTGGHQDWPEGFMGLTGYLSPALKSSSSYKITYNNLDVNFGKNYFISSKLNIEPHIGLKSSWINQTQINNYLINLKQEDLIFFNSILKDDCHYWGLGPKAGLGSQWFIINRLSFVTQVAGSILYGKYKVTDSYLAKEEKNIDKQNMQTSSSVHIKGNTYFFSPFVNMLLGLDFQGDLYRDLVKFRIFLGYEVQYFWRQNEMISAKGTLKNTYNSLPGSILMINFLRSSEDLSFSGLSLLFEIYF